MTTSANTSPIFPGTARIDTAFLQAQVGGRDGATGNYVDILTAGPKGTFVTAIDLVHLGDNPASVIFFYLRPAIGNPRLLFEADLPVLTGSNNTSSNTRITVDLIRVLPNLDTRRALPLPPEGVLTCAAGTALTSGININVYGGDY